MDQFVSQGLSRDPAPRWLWPWPVLEILGFALEYMLFEACADRKYLNCEPMGGVHIVSTASTEVEGAE